MTHFRIERYGDISGITIHKTLNDALKQLEEEYPKVDNVKDKIVEIVGVEKGEIVWNYLQDTLKIEDYLPERQTPDPEDDRILIFEVSDESSKLVWHFSGWHWENDAGDIIDGGMMQGKLPSDEDCLYKIANDY